MSMVTSLAPIIGYDRAAKIAKESASTGRSVRAICVEQHVLPPDQLAIALDLGFIDRPAYEALERESYQVLGLLDRLLNSLSKKTA